MIYTIPDNLGGYNNGIGSDKAKRGMQNFQKSRSLQQT